MRPTQSCNRALPYVVDRLARHPWLFVALFSLLFGALARSGVREKSATFDEIAHLTGGYSAWHTGDFRLNPENGNLPQRWATLPLLAMNLHFPGRDDPHWQSSNVWELGYDFFYTLGNDLEAMLWRSRGMIVLLGMMLGVIVFVWSRRLFGVEGAFLSLAMGVFCPSLLAHSALATSDLTATLLFVAALGCVWIALHRVSPWSVLVSGLVLGGLFVSKMSAVVILPVMLILLVIRLAVGRPLCVVWRKKTSIVRGRWRQLAVLVGVLACQALVVLLVIWLFFGFHFATFRQTVPDRDRMPGNQTVDAIAGDGAIGACVRLANDWHLLPEPYLYGFSFAVKMSESRVAFLKGEFSEQGWRMFFPYSLLVKTPLATLALLAAALAGAVASWAPGSTSFRHRAARGLYQTAPLTVFLIVYWAIAIMSNLNIGHRHLLPTYPLMFILGGAAAYWFRSRLQLVRAVPLVLVAGLIVESTSSYPHYLAFFNRVAGGPGQGYRHLVDSSLDWGQDLPGLKRWLDERRDPVSQHRPTYLSYFGVGNPDHYGLPVKQLPAFPDWRTARETGDLAPGTYCISATNLQSVYLPPRGAWTLESEQQYQALLAAVAELSKRQQIAPPAAQELAAWNNTLSRFELYRFARLCAYLRLREPDDSIGYSILIYHLDADDLNTALFRPLSDWTESASRSN